MTTPEEDFESFVRTSGVGLLRLATLLTGDPGAGEDLLQTVLAAMYGQWAKGRPPDAPEAYARKSLARAAQRVWRRRRAAAETLVAARLSRCATSTATAKRKSLTSSAAASEL
jgi:DNA-directed RNA polymerase specialized sigma24 family protein